MEVYKNGLDSNIELNLVTRTQAKRLFNDGVGIYIKPIDNVWIKLSKDEEVNFPCMDYSIKCYAETQDEAVIISSNANVVKYLKEHGIDGTPLKTASTSDVLDKVVYNFGDTLSLSLIASCKAYYDVQFKDTRDKKAGYNIKRYECKCENVRL